MEVAAPHLDHLLQQLAQCNPGHVSSPYRTVSRSTSSSVVCPVFTFCNPLFRSVIIPICSAFFFNSRAEAPTRISSRSSSLISITSYKPTRPLYPLLLHTLQPVPWYTLILPASSVEKPASINACGGTGATSLH